MLSRRSLLSRCLAALGAAAVAPVAALIPSEPSVVRNRNAGGTPPGGVVLGRPELVRVRFDREQEMRLDAVWAERLQELRSRHVITLNDSEAVYETWDSFRGTWVPAKNALAAWGRG